MSKKKRYVYVRQEVLCFEENRVHLSNTLEIKIDPQDFALLEIVYRGEGNLGLLCSRLAQLSRDPAVDAVAIEKTLLQNLAGPNAILEICPGIDVIKPEVIVCDFSPGESGIDSRRLVKSLRRSHKVLFLGADTKVRGSIRQNLSYAASSKHKLHSCWFQFMQWCRAIVRENSSAVLVLCGPQDAILFGDQTPFLRSIVALDQAWPPRTAAADLWGSDWIPEDSLDATRALFYALLFHPVSDIGSLNRAAASEFAVLEGLAISHAERVLISSVDQGALLTKIGRDPETNSWAPPFQRTLPAWSARETEARSLVLVADLEGGIQPLSPVLHMLADIPHGARPFGRILLWTSTHLYQVVEKEGGGGLVHVAIPPPNSAEVLAGIVFPGLLRNLRLPLAAMGQGFPCFIAPSDVEHPLLTDVPEEMMPNWGFTGDLNGLLVRLMKEGDPMAGDILRAQESFLSRHSVAGYVTELLQEAPSREEVTVR